MYGWIFIGIFVFNYIINVIAIFLMLLHFVCQFFVKFMKKRELQKIYDEA